MKTILHEQVLDSLPEGITIQDREFNIIYQNKAMQRFFGEHRGEKCYAIYERRDDICEGCGVRKAFETGEPNVVLRTAFEADGKTSYFENSCFPLMDANGQIVAGVEVCRNISDRVSLEAEVKDRNIELGQINKQLKKRTDELLSVIEEVRTAQQSLSTEIEQRKLVERELRESEERYRMQFDNALDSIVLADADTGIILDCNSAACNMLGKQLSEIVGHHQHELHPPELLAGEFTETFVQHLCERKGEVLETKVITKDGEIRDVAVMANVFELNGRTTLQGIFRDITVQKKKEQEREMLKVMLAHAQKLEAIGQLAAGVAHEINTPIQFIGDNTVFLREAFAHIEKLLWKYNQLHCALKDSAATSEILAELEATLEQEEVTFVLKEVPKAIDQSLDGVERVTGIVRSMKEFSHPQGREMNNADLNRAIENTVSLSRNEWKYVAEMKLDLDPRLPLVPCFLSDISQVVLNMILNSAHAIAEVGGGTITISTRFAPPWVEIRISDTGVGISEEVRDKIFDPFFTTKEVGKGSGQGLAISDAIITKKHGGTITFETEVGKGTTFLVRLPLVRAR